jgi:hypothetical protein
LTGVLRTDFDDHGEIEIAVEIYVERSKVVAQGKRAPCQDRQDLNAPAVLAARDFDLASADDRVVLDFNIKAPNRNEEVGTACFDWQAKRARGW